MPTEQPPCTHPYVDGDATRCLCRFTAAGHLRNAWLNLLDARISADRAVEQLAGSRAARAEELVAKLSDAVDYVKRLRMVVEGDERAARPEAL